MRLTDVKKEKSRGSAFPETVFGWELVLDLYGCNREAISDADSIRNFANKLWKATDMKSDINSVTPCAVESVKNNKICSIVRIFDSGSVTGHFSVANCAAYLNIFSLEKFNIEKVENFAKNYFGAGTIRSSFIIRK
jgi:hypothetical protein